MQVNMRYSNEGYCTRVEFETCHFISLSPSLSSHSLSFFMDKDPITVHALSLVQCRPSEHDSGEDAILLSRARSVAQAGCRTTGWQTPNAREPEECAHHSPTFHHDVQFPKIYAQAFSKMHSFICPHLHRSRLQQPSRPVPLRSGALGP